MPNKSPTLSESRELYAAADEFRRLAPWTWMSDVNIFGVQDPESGEIGYCGVMGNAGQIFGLYVYQGDDGYAGYRAMAEADEDTFVAAAERQRALVLRFSDREEVPSYGLATIKSLGLKYRGRGAWPLFYSMLPNYLPWPLTGSETRFMTEALKQAHDVASRFRDDPSLLPKMLVGTEVKLLVRVPKRTPEGFLWTDSLQPEPPAPESNLVRLAYSADRSEELADLLPETDGILEIHFQPMPQTPVSEKGERPYIPRVVLIVESKSGFVVNVQTVRAEDTFQKCVDGLLGAIEEIGALPEAVHVQRPDLHQILSIVCNDLNIDCVLRKRLPKLDKTVKSMMRYAMG